MIDISIRLATPPDVHALVEMRDFTFEDPDAEEDINRAGFAAECADFIEDAISGGRWHIWVASGRVSPTQTSH